MNHRLKKGDLIQQSHSLEQLAKPLYEQSPLSIINFIRVYDTREVFYLCDNPAWISEYVSSGLYLQGFFENRGFSSLESSLLWSALPDNDPVVDRSRSKFNIFSGFTLVKAHKNYCDYFNFGSYFDHYKLAQEFDTVSTKANLFCEEFYSKLNRTIYTASSHQRIALQSSIKQSTGLVTPDSEGLYLGARYGHNHITSREMQVMPLVIRGYSAKQIADALFIKERTAVNHLASIKSKLNCNNLCELGFKISDLGLNRHW